MLLFGAIIALAGCTAQDAREPDHSDAWTLAPGGWNEVNLALAQGARIEFEIEPTMPISYDVHSHEGARVVNHIEGAVAGGSAEGTFDAPAAGTYSLFVQAQEKGGVARVRLYGAFEVV
jgi:hypothetical protein